MYKGLFLDMVHHRKDLSLNANISFLHNEVYCLKGLNLSRVPTCIIPTITGPDYGGWAGQR